MFSIRYIVAEGLGHVLSSITTLRAGARRDVDFELLARFFTCCLSNASYELNARFRLSRASLGDILIQLELALQGLLVLALDLLLLLQTLLLLLKP